MASLLPQGKQYFETSAGIPLVGGKVYTYDAGTSNPRTTYQDAAGAQPNVNPVILDARGEAVIFWSGNYKVVLRDSLDNIIWTVDNVSSLLPNIAQTLLPAADNTYDLGSVALAWRNLYLGADHAPVLDTISGNIGYYKRTAAEIAAGVTPANLSYVPGHAFRYGAKFDGTTDDTTALNNALLQAYQTGGSAPIWPEGTCVVSQLFITSPVWIKTAGYATVLQQKSGLGVDKQMVCVRSSDVIIEPFSAIGNISTDTGEFNHCVIVGGTSSISRINVQGVKGTNVRGDVIYLGGTSTFPLYNVTIGVAYGTNVYRNVVSFVGVQGCEVDSIDGTQIGYRTFDIEPNVGTSQAPTDIRIKYVKGANILFAGDTTINNGAIIIDYAELDNSLLADSTPGYPTHPSAGGNLAINVGNTRSLRFGYLKARGFQERLYQSSANAVSGNVIFDYVDISNCNTTEVVFKTLFNLDALVELEIRGGVIALTAVDRYVVKHATNGVHRFRNLAISGGAIAATGNHCEYENLAINASSLASNLFAAISNSLFKNVVVTNDGSATLQLSCNSNTWIGSSAAPATLNSGGNFHVYLQSTFNSVTYDLGSISTAVAFNPGSIATGARSKTSVTVTGAVLTDYAFASFLGVPASGDDATISARVTAANTVTVIFQNTGAGTINFTNDTLRVRVQKSA
jgi:hypothetical protein